MSERVRIIAEIGSCHSGKSDYIHEAIDFCVELGIDAFKFQLFPDDVAFTGAGNIFLPPELYLEALEYADGAIDIGASVFSARDLEFLLHTDPDFVKFSYSKKDKTNWILQSLEARRETVVSCDVMTHAHVPEGATKIFCISRYPVYEQLRFDGLFPKFAGFSDHTLGYEQTLEAVKSGAKIIEKHITLNHADISCPDSYFALQPAELASMVAEIRSHERKMQWS